MMNLNKILIREMNIKDLDSISPILQSEFDEFWNYNVFKQELENKNSKYICALYENNIIAFAGIWICIDEAHITNIVTKKQYRNMGIATRLIRKPNKHGFIFKFK